MNTRNMRNKISNEKSSIFRAQHGKEMIKRGENTRRRSSSDLSKRQTNGNQCSRKNKKAEENERVQNNTKEGMSSSKPAEYEYIYDWNK